VSEVLVRTESEVGALERLLQAYRPKLAGHDEMLAPDGGVRPHWRRFVTGFAALGAEGWRAASDSTRRLLRESGIAFNVYADPDDRAHAWRLDLLPVLLHEEEWRRLQTGLVQRARLLDAVLRDLYGDACLLHEGILPPGLVFGSDEFLRPAVRPEGRRDGPLLRHYACDIARTRDGAWRVIGDQTDIALGNGYLLASRVALSHGLAELFMACHARRLAGYYMGVQQSLRQACSYADGRIVVLSRGPADPSYFSNAYLARYLGYTLVESGDLTVRDNLLYLKTLDGLQRVNLVLRKVPGRHADPLELAGDGWLGVAGLVQAARAGRVVIANGLGAGLVHNRALAPFSARLCRHLLGEDLLLEEAPVLWLGDPGMREAALARLDRLRIGRTTQRSDPGEVEQLIDGATLDPAARARFQDQLRRDGHRMVAQEPLPLATTPAFDGSGIVPVPFAFRAYLALSDKGWSVLPGGLVRMAGEPVTVGLPNGFGSKDLWIVGDAPEAAPVSLLKESMAEVHLRRTGRDLLSRTADNLFWLGRYAERTEGTMRLLRAVLARVLEDSRPDAEPLLLRRLLDVAVGDGPPLPLSKGAGWPLRALEEAVTLLMFEPGRTLGLRESLDQLHRTATLVRDQISHDAWRMLNALHIDRRWRQPMARIGVWPALELLDDGVRFLNAFSGTEAENMTRNYAWRFLEMGRRVERAAHLIDLTRGLVLGGPAPEEDGSLRLLLELGDSFMTYRSRYLMTPLLAPVLDLLLLDETNPRSLAWQLAELDGHLAELPTDGPHRSLEQRMVLRLLTELRLADLAALLRRTPSGARPELGDLLARGAAMLPDLSHVIARTWFAHSETPITTLTMRRREVGDDL
jgi:uncharacterized circularly permuted ATP-grasp superfamily protein/uncharacterized alpha-E superfamily protein